jgi:hypothetical protein
VGRSAEAEYKGSGIRSVVVTATHGLFASAYSDTYDAGERFPNALAEITALVRARTGRQKLAIGRIALVAWSAGYGAVRKVLMRNPSDAIDTVVLLDGLHTAYRDTPEGKTVDMRDLDPFVQFAREAVAGHKLMVVTHSSIVPTGYPGTTETSTALLKAVGLERVIVPEAAPGEAGLTLTSRADQGNFHLRGYAGEDKGSHVGQLHLIEGILRDYLRPRWAKHGG